MNDVRLDTIDAAIAEIAAGRAVVVVDDEDRENEGDLIFAAARATPELLGFMIRYTSGVICVPMLGADADRLKLPPMTHINEDRKGTAFTVTVDAKHGVTTGISAADRAHTVRTLADSATEAYELTRPGHIFPLRAVDGGVLRRPGHTEAAVDLATLAGLSPVGVVCEIVHDDGSMMRAPALREFADAHGLVMISIADLIRYRRHAEHQIEKLATTRLPTVHGVFTAHAYRDMVDGSEHLALVMGDVGSGDVGPGDIGSEGVGPGDIGSEGVGPGDGSSTDVSSPYSRADQPVLVRLHSECLTGDTFGSRRCDCGPQLQAALRLVAQAGRGVIVYLRGHEGRGIGLAHKLQAYQLQDGGLDTVDANVALGLPADARDYGTGAQILASLGIQSIALMTNNPAKLTGVEGYGLKLVERVALPVEANSENLRYLTTKRDRLGHELGDLPVIPGTTATGAPGPEEGRTP